MSTTTPAGFRNDIQGIRAIAVALVVVYHAGVVMPGGFIGVDVFFVVSGFVITRMLLKEFDAQGKINFRNFYLRRIRRLLPALGLMLGVTLLLSAILAAIAAQPIGDQPLPRLRAGQIAGDLRAKADSHALLPVAGPGLIYTLSRALHQPPRHGPFRSPDRHRHPRRAAAADR